MQVRHHLRNFSKLVKTRLPLCPKSGLSDRLLRPISSSARSGPQDAFLQSVRLSAALVECPGSFVRLAVCISNALTSVVQGERRGKLAWPLLSRRPHSPLQPICNGKGTTFPLRFTNLSATFFILFYEHLKTLKALTGFRFFRC